MGLDEKIIVLKQSAKIKAIQGFEKTLQVSLSILASAFISIGLSNYIYYFIEYSILGAIILIASLSLTLMQIFKDWTIQKLIVLNFIVFLIGVIFYQMEWNHYVRH